MAGRLSGIRTQIGHVYSLDSRRNSGTEVKSPCLGRVWAVPRLYGYTLAFALQLRKNVRKNLSQGSSVPLYQGADKSLARPGRKQARKYVRDGRDFNNIETRAVIKFFFSFFPARQGAEGNSRHSDRNSSPFPSRSG